MADKNEDTSLTSSTSGFKNVKKKISSAFNHSYLPQRGRRSSSSSDTCKSNSPVARSRLKSSASLSPSNSVDEGDLAPFEIMIQYLGYKELRSPGFDDIVENVNNIYKTSKKSIKTITKSTMSLSAKGITIRTNCESNNKTTEQIFKPQRILYCGVDKQHQRVFLFNYQFDRRAEYIHLHVIVCKTNKEAKSVAKYIAKLSKSIQQDIHRKEKEEKHNHTVQMTKLKMKSNPSITEAFSGNLSPDSSKGTNCDGSKENSCSGMSGSGEWVPGRIISQLSIA